MTLPPIAFPATRRWRSALAPAVALAAALAGTPALAHETWLSADQRSVQPGKALHLDMTSGEHFPTPGSAIAAERIETAACRQGDAKFAITPSPHSTKTAQPAKALRLTTLPPAATAVVCWVELKPRALDLSLAKVAQYLDEIDAPKAARDIWAAMPAPRRWHEVYTKNAKVVVPGVADASSSPLMAQPVGLKLEFVPQADLSTGHISGSLPVTVLRDGQPLAGLAVALSSERGGPPQWQNTDAQGKVVFAAPKPGSWMLSATDLRSLDAAAGEWESQFATLVFEVRRLRK